MKYVIPVILRTAMTVEAKTEEEAIQITSDVVANNPFVQQLAETFDVIIDREHVINLNEDDMLEQMKKDMNHTSEEGEDIFGEEYALDTFSIGEIQEENYGK